MAQPSELYVDPSINADSGTGTSGDPYGDLEYCLEQEDWDATNGIRVNVKSGSTETLAADISTAMADVSAPGKSVAWTPGSAAPMVIQGYTSAAGDGGKCDISGGGSTTILDASTQDHTHFIDCRLQNTGANIILHLNSFCSVVRCELDNATGTGDNIDLGGNSVFMSNYVHNIAGNCSFQISNYVSHNVFENGTNDFTEACKAGSSTVVTRNIFDLDGASKGIIVKSQCYILNNSIYSNGGTGAGIEVDNSTTSLIVANNLIEGFSGAGGYGIRFKSTGQVLYYFGNSVENCTTDFDNVYDWTLDTGAGGYGGNESLAASPFTSASTNDFSPVDTGSVKEGSLPADFGDGAI